MISLVPPLLSRTALLFLLTATGAATAARPAADIILHNGNIITLNDAQPQASALVISGSRIVAIGDDTATDEWRGDHTLKTRWINYAPTLTVVPTING